MNWDLYKDILSIDSTSGKERELAEWLLANLEAPHKEAMEVGDGTLNLLLCWGTPQVVFCTHMDTVPPYIAPVFHNFAGDTPSGGTPLAPAPPTVSCVPCGDLYPAGPSPCPCPGVDMSAEGSIPAKKETITGRGTCDAKGQILAMYTACKELEAEGKTGFGLLLLSGEETGSWGAKAFSKTAFRAPFLIVGEPTENKLVSAAKGTLSYDLKFAGQAFHSGYPQYGTSAIDRFNEFYNKLKAIDFGEDPELGATTWNVGLLRSNNPQNILSPELTCRLYFRTTFVSHEAVQRWMSEQVLFPEASLRDPVRANASGNSICPAVSGSFRGGDVPARYVTLPGFAQAPVAFGSDAPHLSGFGHKLIIGPGSIRFAHRDDEHIGAEELAEAVRLYKNIFARLQETTNQL